MTIKDKLRRFHSRRRTATLENMFRTIADAEALRLSAIIATRSVWFSNVTSDRLVQDELET